MFLSGVTRGDSYFILFTSLLFFQICVSPALGQGVPMAGGWGALGPGVSRRKQTPRVFFLDMHTVIYVGECFAYVLL